MLNKARFLRTAKTGSLLFGIVFTHAISGLSPAYADQTVTVDFTATYTYVEPTCDISSEQNSLVALGTFSPADFPSKGKVSPNAVTFHILLDCNGDIEDGVAIQFSGTEAGNGLLALNNPEDEGTAQGVAVVIYDNEHTFIPLGSDSKVYAAVSGHNDLAFRAGYKSLTDTVTPGIAKATATFIIDYP